MYNYPGIAEQINNHTYMHNSQDHYPLPSYVRNLIFKEYRFLGQNHETNMFKNITSKSLHSKVLLNDSSEVVDVEIAPSRGDPSPRSVTASVSGNK